jgi:hypothetical protein
MWSIYLNLWYILDQRNTCCMIRHVFILVSKSLDWLISKISPPRNLSQLHVFRLRKRQVVYTHCNSLFYSKRQHRYCVNEMAAQFNVKPSIPVSAPTSCFHLLLSAWVVLDRPHALPRYLHTLCLKSCGSSERLQSSHALIVFCSPENMSHYDVSFEQINVKF